MKKEAKKQARRGDECALRLPTCKLALEKLMQIPEVPISYPDGLRVEHIPMNFIEFWKRSPRLLDGYDFEDDIINYYFAQSYMMRLYSGMRSSILNGFDFFHYFVVYEEEEDSYVVYDGNLRLAVYNVLLYPEIIYDHELRRELHAKRILRVYNVPCLVFSDKRHIMEILPFLNDPECWDASDRKRLYGF